MNQGISSPAEGSARFQLVVGLSLLTTRANTGPHLPGGGQPGGHATLTQSNFFPSLPSRAPDTLPSTVDSHPQPADHHSLACAACCNRPKFFFLVSENGGRQLPWTDIRLGWDGTGNSGTAEQRNRERGRAPAIQSISCGIWVAWPLRGIGPAGCH